MCVCVHACVVICSNGNVTSIWSTDYFVWVDIAMYLRVCVCVCVCLGVFSFNTTPLSCIALHG